MKHLPLKFILCLVALAIVSSHGQGQAQEFNSNFGDLLAAPPTPDAKFSARYIVNKNRKGGVLQLTADVLEGCHIFSVTQKPNGPGQRTEISLGEDYTQIKLTGKFEPDQDFELHESEFADEIGEEHHGVVTWSAPFEFTEAVDPDDRDELVVPVTYFAQVCVDGDGGACLQFDGTLDAKSAAAAVAHSFSYSPEGSHVTVSGWADVTHAQPGDTINLNVKIEPEAGWHVGAYAQSPAPGTTPSLVVISKSNDAKLADPTATPEPTEVTGPEGKLLVHKKAVTINLPLELPKDLEEKKHGFVGFLGVNASDEDSESVFTSLKFKFKVEVGSATVDAKNDFNFFDSQEKDYSEIASLAQKEYERNKKNAGQFADYPIPTVLGLAFLAGLILNVMPCVLPVIGLKVLSFVQQAGENPRRVLFLNLTFAAGIIAVFMLLAAFAAFMGLGWGGLFESQAFTIVMVTIVFAFGLSFLGVWEIPIPGFVASSGSGKAAHQEGYSGAFIKGILTTLLATPCSGPLLIPAVTWAIAQPPAITFLAFFAMGLGMAFPFILIGFKPSLVSFLPKPGEWMETFKQLMGFVMIATAVFFFNPVSDKLEMPTLAFLVFIAIACWMAGRISLLQEFPVRMKKWAAAVAVACIGGFVAFYLMVPQHELDWQPYSSIAVKEQLAEGNVVFVDFTADW